MEITDYDKIELIRHKITSVYKGKDGQEIIDPYKLAEFLYTHIIKPIEKLEK